MHRVFLLKHVYMQIYVYLHKHTYSNARLSNSGFCVVEFMLYRGAYVRVIFLMFCNCSIMNTY